MTFIIDNKEYSAYDFVDCYVFLSSLQYRLQDLNDLEPYEVKFLFERAEDLKIKSIFRTFFYTSTKNKREIRRAFKGTRVIDITSKKTYATLKELSNELNIKMTIIDDHIRNKLKIKEKNYVYTKSLYKKLD